MLVDQCMTTELGERVEMNMRLKDYITDVTSCVSSTRS